MPNESPATRTMIIDVVAEDACKWSLKEVERRLQSLL
jgi:hypothetical protein